jgi:uncharacterized coiled-coil protein SlyX
MNTETIHTSYQPITQYWQAVEHATGEKPTPPFTLRGIDVFLMRQVAAYYPIPLQVIDLAAEQTLGASSLAWAGEQTPAAQVFTACTTNGALWTTWLSHHLKHCEATGNRAPIQLVTEASFAQLMAFADRNPMHGVCIVAVLPEALDVNERTALVEMWLSTNPKAILFVLPFGKVGEAENVCIALNACKAQPAFTFRLGREISAMFGTSQLGIFYPKNNAYLPHIFDRLQTLYEGNFNFAALLNDNTSLRLRLKRLEGQLSHYEQLVNQQAQQIASHQAAQQGLEAQLAALVNAPPQPQLINSPPSLPLDGRQVPLRQTSMDRLRLRLSSVALGLRARLLARLFYPRRLRVYKAQILGCSVPQRMVAGTTYEGLLIILNAGQGTWYPSYRTPHCVNVSYHWRDKRGRMVVKEGLRTPLPHDVAPGERVTVPFQVAAPALAGGYRLQPDLVHEGVRWLGELYNFPSYPVEVVAP